MSFYDSGTFETLNQTNPMPTDSAVKPPVTGNVTVELNKTPDSVENLPQQGGLSYQEIYSKNSRYPYIRHEIKDQSLCYTPDHKFAVVSNVSVSMRDNTGSEISELVEITTLIN